MLDKKVFAELEKNFDGIGVRTIGEMAKAAVVGANIIANMAKGVAPGTLTGDAGAMPRDVIARCDYTVTVLKLLQLFMCSDGYMDESERDLYDRFCEAINADEERKNIAKEYASSIPDVDAMPEYPEWITLLEKVKKQEEDYKKTNWVIYKLYYKDYNRLFLLWRIMLQMAYADGKCSKVETSMLEQAQSNWELNPIVCAALEDMERTNQMLWQQKRWLTSEEKPKEGIQFIDERLERLKHDFAVTCDEYNEIAVHTETPDFNQESE